MTKEDFVLACLSPADGEPYSSVQLQKLLFLVDANVPDATGGPHFQFKPWDYGPFDLGVFIAVQALAEKGHVVVTVRKGIRGYRLSVRGQRLGEKHLACLIVDAQDYIRRASAFVRKHGFTQLLSAIYAAYPEMAVNAVFHRGTHATTVAA